MDNKTIIFHGGCHGCEQSELGGTGVCLGCCYFEADWRLPDLNDATAAKKKQIDDVRHRIRSGG